MTIAINRLSFRGRPAKRSLVQGNHLVVSIVLLAMASLLPGQADTRYTVNGRVVPASTYQAHKLMNESLQLMRENRAQNAAEKLKRALIILPGSPEARGMYGMALARLGKTEEALEQMRMSMAGGKQLPATYMNLAALYQASGRTEDAVKVYKRLLNEVPDTKMSAAIQERVTLLEKELKHRQEVHLDREALALRDKTYYENVVTAGRKRWSDSAMPLRVYVYPGDGLPGYHERYDKILHESFEEWQRVSNGKIKFAFQSRPTDADITCTWIDNPALLESSAEGGEAQMRAYAQSLVRAQIMLSLNDGGSAFPYTDNLVRTLCLHEIGHSLGLIGHSTQAGDVMYCSTPLVDLEQHLSARDVATLNAVYAKPVDGLSELIWQVHHRTHGNTENVIRLAVIVVTAVVACLIAFLALTRKASKKKRKA